MKQILNKLLLLLVVAAFAVPFTSCSDNDSDPTPEKKEDTNPLQVKIDSISERHGWTTLLDNSLNLHWKEIVFSYTSVGPDLKTPVRLTGEIIMSDTLYNKKVDPGQVLIYNQCTTAKKRERLSQDELDEFALYSINKNRITISADMYGWTLTEDKPQAYCCTDIVCKETMDAYDAACYLLDSLGYDIEGLPIYNTGYSSGALSAIAMQKYVDANRSDIKFTATAAGGGPYDLAQVYKDYVEADTCGYLCSLPLMVVAYNETFNLGYKYSDIFQDPLGSHVQDWILSKNYSTQEINDLLGREHHISEILTPAAYDTTSTIGSTLLKKFRANSVCGPGQTWQPCKTTKYYIYHTTGDLYIPYTIGVEMADYLKGKGCDVTTVFANHGNHVSYGLPIFALWASVCFQSKK